MKVKEVKGGRVYCFITRLGEILVWLPEARSSGVCSLGVSSRQNSVIKFTPLAILIQEYKMLLARPTSSSHRWPTVNHTAKTSAPVRSVTPQ